MSEGVDVKAGEGGEVKEGVEKAGVEKAEASSVVQRRRRFGAMSPRMERDETTPLERAARSAREGGDRGPLMAYLRMRRGV